MPLQKSFSEQNGSKNERKQGQWQRRDTYNGPRFDKPKDENRKTEAPIPQLPAEASPAAKRKLTSFSFGAETKTKPSRSKAGSTSNPINLDEEEKVQVADMPVTKIASRLQQLSQDESAKKSKGPGTPSGRLALPDLLNMADVDSPSRILAKTPDDRVSWNHDPAAYSSSGFSYGETRGTKRRRAKSSSPMSSPARSTHFEVDTPGLPIGKLGLDTPQLGPGLDLWSNYGMSGAPSASGSANPLMAQLTAGTPSPRDSARKLGLARSVSMGDQVMKKRRIGTERPGYGLFEDIAKGSVTKHPRVGALLDGIREKSLRSSGSAPSSTSPAGIRYKDDNVDVDMESSPLAPRTMGPPPKAVSAPEALTKMLTPVVEEVEEVEPAAVKLPSSPQTDYGDDEYDDAMFHEASLQVYGTQNQKPRQPSSSPSKRKASITKPIPPVPQAKPPPPQAAEPARPKYVAPKNRPQGLPQPHVQKPLQAVQQMQQPIPKPTSKPISRQATLPAQKPMAAPLPKIITPPKPAAKPAFVFNEEEDEFAGVFSDLDDAEIIPDANAIQKKYNAKAAAATSSVNTAKLSNATVSRAPLAAKPVVRSENVPPPKTAYAAQSAYKPASKPQVVAANLTYKPPVKAPVIAPADDDYDKFFDDDDDEDFGIAAKQVEQQAQQTRSTAASSYPPPSGSEKPRVIQRYLVISVSEQQYENERGRVETEKVVQVQPDKSKETYIIHLRGFWIETPVSEQAFVHIIGDFSPFRSIIIDDLHNMIILHPDHLLSSTVVADSFSCTRRAVLQDRVKATSDISGPLVYGTMLHEVFQESMMANRWDTPWLYDLIDRTCKAHLEQLYIIKTQIPVAVEHMRSKVNELQAWASVFVSPTPQEGAVVSAGNGEKARMAITKLLDVEEHVWSPMYGLKGNIDATVQVTMEDIKTRKQRTLTVPFEVKTGKSVNASHRAQTALYNLLLSDRYDIEIVYGILYYMESSETVRIPRIRHELRHMIMQRNALAVFVRDKSTRLPPMLKKEPLCQRCYAKTTCFIYHKLAEDGDGETSGMKGKFDEVVKHLTPRHKDFFLKWDDLLTKEERESMKFRRELWTMLSKEREKLGRCFSNVVIEPGTAYEEVDAAGGKINRFRYTLIRDGEGGSFLESQIVVGEPIVISDEKGHFALANGYVTHVRKHRVTVAVDRRLHNARIRKANFDEENNQVFASIMDVNTKPGATQASTQPEAVIRYRLDKDEFSNGMATVRNNLIQIMTDSAFGALKIRSQIVDLVAPKFRTSGTQYEIKDRASLNIDQRRAIQKVMSAEDYALVLGMPGTGKTTTIAHIIRALVGQGKSVLLTSYTHSAVDNILLKMKDDAIPILRLGAPAKIHPEVQTFARLASKAQETFADIHTLWHDSPIVATTCLGTNHALFSERTFDYCIVDEASQITLPVCLGPIRLAKTFVLVGDHNQLPPLVQNEDARKGGLDISLFKLLSDAAPEAVCVLSHQYRMCEDVMELSNNLIYSGRLKCGTKAVAERRLHVPNPAGLMACHMNPQTPAALTRKEKMCIGPHKGCWLADLLDPATKACFLDTDTHIPTSRESAAGNRIVNPLEAKVVTQLVSALLAIGIPGDEIGVMTHYRSQLALLKHGMKGLDQEVEMHTCDRFQGRDKEVVVISLVRSNENASIGELLKDWRRINVAFTRAKSKLIVVGSGSTLKGLNSQGGAANEEMVGQFVRLMESKKWVYNLPPEALEMHCFDDGLGTQVSTMPKESPEAGRWKKVDRKENVPPRRGLVSEMKAKREPKRQGVSERVMLDGRPVLRDIVNEYVG